MCAATRPWAGRTVKTLRVAARARNAYRAGHGLQEKLQPRFVLFAPGSREAGPGQDLAAARQPAHRAGVAAPQFRRQAGAEQDIKSLASWKAKATRTEEIPFVVS